ncbi:MAG: DsbA family protein [Acidimicrobiia bacterium]|nr:DsbA family protein [Acidimicrobiia bacterium]
MKIISWSDYACPFAYIGFKRLLKARPPSDQSSESNRVTWRAYELHPEIPAGGLERPRGKYGSLKALAEEDGLTLRASDRVWSSRPSLLAAEVARAQGKHAEIHERFFSAAWEEGLDLGRSDVLRTLISDVGLDPITVLNEMTEQRYLDAIVDALEEAMMLGITGTPSYLLNGAVLRGVQEVEALL